MSADLIDQTEETIIDYITCPACSEYIRPPSRCCENGHFLCSEGCCGSEQCPVCGTEHFPNKNNIVFDSILKEIYYPCANQENGCEGFFKYDELKDHQEECAFNMAVCVFPGCLKKLGPGDKEAHEAACLLGTSCKMYFVIENEVKMKCSWRGPIGELESHALEHSMTWFSGMIACEVPTMRMLPLAMDFEKIELIKLHDINELFWMYIRVTAEDRQTIAVQYVGEVEKAAGFLYSVEFRNLPKRVMLEDAVISPHVSMQDIYSSPSCIDCRYAFLKNHFLAERVIDYYFKISRKETTMVELRRSIAYSLEDAKNWHDKKS